jgi:hypothetical protein
VCACAAVAADPQPLYKKLLGFEVFGLGFMTSVVSSSDTASYIAAAQSVCEQQAALPGLLPPSVGEAVVIC